MDLPEFVVKRLNCQFSVRYIMISVPYSTSTNDNKSQTVLSVQTFDISLNLNGIRLFFLFFFFLAVFTRGSLFVQHWEHGSKRIIICFVSKYEQILLSQIGYKKNNHSRKTSGPKDHSSFFRIVAKLLNLIKIAMNK